MQPSIAKASLTKTSSASNSPVYTSGTYPLHNWQTTISDNHRANSDKISSILRKKTCLTECPATTIPATMLQNNDNNNSIVQTKKTPQALVKNKTEKNVIQRSFLGFLSKFARGFVNVVTFGQVDVGYSSKALDDYLKILEKGTIENDFDSDNKARDIVRKRTRYSTKLTTNIKILLIEEMLKGITAGGDEDAIITLIREATVSNERQKIIDTIGRERLWDNFSYGNRRVIEALTLTANDLNNNETINRLKKLSKNQLTDYLNNAADPAIKTAIGKISSLKDITTPVAEVVGLNFNLQAKGVISFTHANVMINISPDIIGNTGSKSAITRVELVADQSPGYTVVGGIVKSFIPMAPITANIQTIYKNSSVASQQSSYGRGTTKADRAAGNTSIKFHESQHSLTYLRFFEQNPAPVFQGTKGMTEQVFINAYNIYRKKAKEYFTKAGTYNTKQTDCPGTPMPKQLLQGEGYSETFCEEK